MLGLAPFEKRDFDIFNAMDDFDRNFFGDRMNRMLNTSSFSKFRTDISETENGYLLEAELPGFKKEDISIDIDQEYLTISAKNEENKEEKDSDNRYIRKERFSGSFSRSFGIAGIDPDSISAEYTDGILKIMMPKKSEFTKRLEIK